MKERQGNPQQHGRIPGYLVHAVTLCLLSLDPLPLIALTERAGEHRGGTEKQGGGAAEARGRSQEYPAGTLCT